IAVSRSSRGAANLCLVITGVGFPTRSIRVQWPQYWGQVGSTSASTLVGYRWVRPSTAHISASCSESLAAYGCEGQSARRSLNTGIMYRRTGSSPARRVQCAGTHTAARSRRLAFLEWFFGTIGFYP